MLPEAKLDILLAHHACADGVGLVTGALYFRRAERTFADVI